MSSRFHRGLLMIAVLPFCGVKASAQSTAQPAPTLDTVTVRSKREVDYSTANPTKYNLFIERKAQGNGFFMTRAQIEAHPTTRIESLFSNIPGIKVRQSGTAWTIQSQRCASDGLTKSGGGRNSNVPGANADALGPMVFIDGHALGGTSDLDLLRPGDIEAIEVYQGASQMPAEARGRGCFAIFLWTRTP